MTVQRNNNSATDYSAGLVAVSSYQGWRHLSGRQSEVEQQGVGATALNRLSSSFSMWNPLQSFGYVWNGHTALIVREAGLATRVVGFNPKHAMLTGMMKLFTTQFTTTGEWYDDRPMMDDPTAISYEIHIGQNRAAQFSTYLQSLIGRSDLGPHSDTTFPFSYTFKPGDMESPDAMNSNCGHAALHVINQFLKEWGMGNYADMFRDFLNRDASTRNMAQGRVMGAVTQGFGS